MLQLWPKENADLTEGAKQLTKTLPKIFAVFMTFMAVISDGHPLRTWIAAIRHIAITGLITSIIFNIEYHNVVNPPEKPWILHINQTCACFFLILNLVYLSFAGSQQYEYAIEFDRETIAFYFFYFIFAVFTL